MKVLVVGAGIGGLCLAQGLRGAGVAVQVFERAGNPAVGGGAYRLRLDEQGIGSLARCLPSDLLELFRVTCNPPRAPRVAILDHQLGTLLSWDNGPAPADSARMNAVTNRQTLCEILLAGLDDVVECGREVVRVEDKGDSARVYFADGGVEEGDLVVAADGIDSVVRQQLLPDASVVDPGLWGIYGQASLDIELLRIMPEAFFGGSAPILAPDSLTLVVGAWQPATDLRRAAADLVPYARLSQVDECIQWTLVGAPRFSLVHRAGPQEAFNVAAETLLEASPERLRDFAYGLTEKWHPALSEMIAQSVTASMSVFPIRAALPVPPWPTGRVTLLGDAIHASTAIGGAGANTALRDAAALTDRLADVAAGRAGLLDAIAGYEERMREYGFAASLSSLHSAERIFRVYIPELDTADAVSA